MAHIQSKCSNALEKSIHKQVQSSSSRYKVSNLADFRKSNCKIVAMWRRRREKHKSAERVKGFRVQCSTSPTNEVLGAKIDQQMGGERKDQFGYVLREFGWKVRRLAEDKSEMRKVAQIQAEAFHQPMLLFNDIFLEYFKAEVLAGLLYRLRNSAPDRYACLVAEAETDDDTEQVQVELVGVVDVTVQRDESALQHLFGADEYLYVSGIAVSTNFRRRKVATALLKACDMVSGIWGFDYLVLRAYEDDYGALKLYRNAGYVVVSADPPWTTSWIGRRRRVLMIKKVD